MDSAPSLFRHHETSGLGYTTNSKYLLKDNKIITCKKEKGATLKSHTQN
jgi:hypothetical protein